VLTEELNTLTVFFSQVRIKFINFKEE